MPWSSYNMCTFDLEKESQGDKQGVTFCRETFVLVIIYLRGHGTLSLLVIDWISSVLSNWLEMCILIRQKFMYILYLYKHSYTCMCFTSIKLVRNVYFNKIEIYIYILYLYKHSYTCMCFTSINSYFVSGPGGKCIRICAKWKHQSCKMNGPRIY